MTKINNKKFPTLATLEKVWPGTESKLPLDYAGTSEDKHLAYSFGSALQRMTYDEFISIPKPVAPDYMVRKDAKLFATEFLRFNLNKDEIDSIYDFDNLFVGALSESDVNYCVAIASKYSGNKLTNVLSILNIIRDYQIETLERKGKEIVLPTIEELENLFSLSAVLRSEGIVMATQYLWVAASHWKSEEVLLMVAEGLELRKAMELYTMGFTTMEEIIEYSDIIPDSWIDRILDGPPESDVKA